MSIDGFRIQPRQQFIYEVPSKDDTALSIYNKFSDTPNTFLLEFNTSVRDERKHSIIGLPCSTVIKVRGYEIQVEQEKNLIASFIHKNPLEFIEKLHGQVMVDDNLDFPYFSGGWVGYFGYECIGYIEPYLNNVKKTDDLNNADILLMLSDEVIVFDDSGKRVFIVINIDTSKNNVEELAQMRLSFVKNKLAKETADITTTRLGVFKEDDITSNFSKSEYTERVELIKNYIKSGDCMQVVLSQRLSMPFLEKPICLYHNLIRLNPSPYMFFFDMGDLQIVGCSPEMFIRVEKRKIETRSIAGTRPRGINAREDLAMEVELLSDTKEIAEHIMLVDLWRNDLGKVSETGTVEVPSMMTVERYSHVMHIVSSISGQLQKEVSALEAIKAAFPAGPVTGAPKIRAMQIIDELEREKRGIYSGAIGYLSNQGDVNTAIAIRTAVIKNGCIFVQAGAGIVADSLPDREWDETNIKAMTIMKAVVF